MVKIYIMAVLLFSGCTIRPPDVNVTSEKTALENQLFGDRGRVINTPESAVSLWAILDQEPGDTAGIDMSRFRDEYYKRKLALAQIRRNAALEYINELKKQGVFGESNDGMLAVMPDSIEQGSLIYSLAEAENYDRNVILEFYYESRGVDLELEKSAVKNEFARIMVNVSPEGTWVEDYGGNWVRK